MNSGVAVRKPGGVGAVHVVVGVLVNHGHSRGLVIDDCPGTAVTAITAAVSVSFVAVGCLSG